MPTCNVRLLNDQSLRWYWYGIWQLMTLVLLSICAKYDGKVTYADADKVKYAVKMVLIYHIQNLRRSNSGTAYNQHAKGWRCRWKRRLYRWRGPSMEKGSTALGQNPIVACMKPREGYSFRGARYRRANAWSNRCLAKSVTSRIRIRNTRYKAWAWRVLVKFNWRYLEDLDRWVLSVVWG